MRHRGDTLYIRKLWILHKLSTEKFAFWEQLAKIFSLSCQPWQFESLCWAESILYCYCNIWVDAELPVKVSSPARIPQCSTAYIRDHTNWTCHPTLLVSFGSPLCPQYFRKAMFSPSFLLCESKKPDPVWLHLKLQLNLMLLSSPGKKSWISQLLCKPGVKFPQVLRCLFEQWKGDCRVRI